MDNDEIKMREEFEAWFLETNGWQITKPVHYEDIRTKAFYKCWQAAYRPKQVGDVNISEKLSNMLKGEIESQLGLMGGCTKKHIASMLEIQLRPYIRNLAIAAMQPQTPVKDL